MALQTKTFSKSTSNGYTLELVVVENSTDISTNTSSVSYTLQLKSGNTGFSQYGLGASVSLDGSVVGVRDRWTEPQVSIGYNSTLVILTGTATIKHSANGSKTMPVAFSIDMADESYTPGPMSATGSMDLTTIPQGLVHIDTGSGFVTYQAYIDNGSSWGLYLPYIDTGSAWAMY